MLKRPDYITYNEDGAIDRLFCKMCGEPIAGTVEAPRGSGAMASRLVMRFRRFPNYIEAKFLFDDGHFHVTNGCKNCITMGLTPTQMEELHAADLGLMPGVDATPGVNAVRVVALDSTGVGML